MAGLLVESGIVKQGNRKVFFCPSDTGQFHQYDTLSNPIEPTPSVSSTVPRRLRRAPDGREERRHPLDAHRPAAEHDREPREQAAPRPQAHATEERRAVLRLFPSRERVDARHVKGVQVLYGHGGAKWVDRTIIGPTACPSNNDLLISKEPFSNAYNANQQRMWQALDKQ
jgi:hypothetical protein